MKKQKILGAMNEFSAYLTENLGEPINIRTIGAFSTMVRKVVEALIEE